MQDMRLQDKEEKSKEKNYKEESQKEIEIIHPRISSSVSRIERPALIVNRQYSIVNYHNVFRYCDNVPVFGAQDLSDF